MNMQKVKNMIKSVLPPLFVKACRIITKNGRLPLNTFEGIYENFSDIKNATGYDSQESLKDTYTETVEKFRNFLVDEKILPQPTPRSQISNLLPMLVATFMDREKEISILDYGGGMGTSYIDCLNSIDCANIKYYVIDLMKKIELGRKIFPQEYSILFLEDISELHKVNIVYLGSTLQYIQDYKALLAELISKAPKYILLTDHFMGKMKTFATTQVNMQGRRMAYWIFELKEIIQLFRDNNYSLIYKSVNYQPCHHFDNFPLDYRVAGSCNLLFRKEDS